MNLLYLRHNKSLEKHVSSTEKSLDKVAKLCAQTQRVEGSISQGPLCICSGTAQRNYFANLGFEGSQAARTISGWGCFVDSEALLRR